MGTTKFWMLNNSGKLILAAEFATLDDARKAAHDWNRDETRGEMRVDIIQNARHAVEATRVTAVYSPSPVPLFDRLSICACAMCEACRRRIARASEGSNV